jgi:hypothetical protein
MNLKKRFGMGAIFALLLAVMLSGTAFAHYCTPTQKNDGAGSIGTFNIMTGEFTPNRSNFSDENGDGFPDLLNGGFITLTDGASFSYDLFAHTTLPAGALSSGPDGVNQCDGMGIDNALVCLGILH